MDKKVFVIKDSKGGYIGSHTYTKTDSGWCYLYYTGLTTGFTSWDNEQTAEKELIQLQNFSNKYNFGRNFHLEYIDVENIPIGEAKIESMFFCILDENNLFVDRKSIIKFENEYYYLPYVNKIGVTFYSRLERVLESLKVLELYNKFGNLGHSFHITTV
jgi:hypothetical protein